MDYKKLLQIDDDQLIKINFQITQETYNQIKSIQKNQIFQELDDTKIIMFRIYRKKIALNTIRAIYNGFTFEEVNQILQPRPKKKTTNNLFRKFRGVIYANSNDSSKCPITEIFAIVQIFNVKSLKDIKEHTQQSLGAIRGTLTKYKEHIKKGNFYYYLKDVLFSDIDQRNSFYLMESFKLNLEDDIKHHIIEISDIKKLQIFKRLKRNQPIPYLEDYLADKFSSDIIDQPTEQAKRLLNQFTEPLNKEPMETIDKEPEPTDKEPITTDKEQEPPVIAYIIPKQTRTDKPSTHYRLILHGHTLKIQGSPQAFP